MKFLYLGGYQLPDKNAAAQRVIGIAKLLRFMGHEVVFYNESKDKTIERVETYFGFRCIEGRKSSQYDYLFTAKSAIKVIKNESPDCVITYNYPGKALLGIIRFCHNNCIKCIADVTEWYEPHGSLIHRAVMKYDINTRMNHAHLKVDGVIAISTYLYDYYCDKVNTVQIPPIIDINEKKWIRSQNPSEDYTSFIYAGTPYSKKERLDLIVSGIRSLSNKHKVKLYVIGVNEKQYRALYNDYENNEEVIEFIGRIPHEEVVRRITIADWSIIIRDNNRLVRAGFPTKLVESISAGTPVIVNPFSNVLDYLNNDNSIVTSIDKIEDAMEAACSKRITPDNTIFDYRNYQQEISKLLSK